MCFPLHISVFDELARSLPPLPLHSLPDVCAKPTPGCSCGRCFQALAWRTYSNCKHCACRVHHACRVLPSPCSNLLPSLPLLPWCAQTDCLELVALHIQGGVGVQPRQQDVHTQKETVSYQLAMTAAIRPLPLSLHPLPAVCAKPTSRLGVATGPGTWFLHNCKDCAERDLPSPCSFLLPFLPLLPWCALTAC
jgi:hypothetical protein